MHIFGAVVVKGLQLVTGGSFVGEKYYKSPMGYTTVWEPLLSMYLRLLTARAKIPNSAEV